MILLASVSFIVSKLIKNNRLEDSKLVTAGFYIFNWSLLVFWLVLITGGIYKALWMDEFPKGAFTTLQESSSSIFMAFIISGCILFSGLAMLTIPMIKRLISHLLAEENK